MTHVDKLKKVRAGQRINFESKDFQNALAVHMETLKNNIPTSHLYTLVDMYGVCVDHLWQCKYSEGEVFLEGQSHLTMCPTKINDTFDDHFKKVDDSSTTWGIDIFQKGLIEFFKGTGTISRASKAACRSFIDLLNNWFSIINVACCWLPGVDWIIILLNNLLFLGIVASVASPNMRAEAVWKVFIDTALGSTLSKFLQVLMPLLNLAPGFGDAIQMAMATELTTRVAEAAKTMIDCLEE